jgi:hypothetical protein
MKPRITKLPDENIVIEGFERLIILDKSLGISKLNNYHKSRCSYKFFTTENNIEALKIFKNKRSTCTCVIRKGKGNNTSGEWWNIFHLNTIFGETIFDENGWMEIVIIK